MNANYLMIFEKNTDAIGTNRGFLYQYLLTLKEWLNNFIEKNNKIIFCETEDDLKEISELEEFVSFKQMKCYSKPFSLKSNEIKKSLYNFFTLFLKYQCNKFTSFEFVTNTTVISSDLILKKWTSNTLVAKNSKNKLVIEMKKILIDIVNEDAQGKVDAINRKIKKRKEKLSNDNEDKKISEEIKKLEDDIIMIEEAKEILVNKINDNNIIIPFINSITWRFDNIETNKVIDDLKLQCMELIKKIDKASLSPNIVLCRLLTEICCKSAESDIENRTLSVELMDKIINESEEEIMSKQSISLHLLLDNRFDKIEDILESIRGEIKNLCYNNNSSVENVNYYNMPYYDYDEIEEFIKHEDKEKQSNLENKIDMIGLKKEDCEYLKDIAREHRCSYLLYLDSLRVANLEQEFGNIKNIERDVRRLCFEAVQNIENEKNFDSKKFWSDFRKELELKSKEFSLRRKCSIDNSIIHGQMYQMAAECPLRWHK